MKVSQVLKSLCIFCICMYANTSSAQLSFGASAGVNLASLKFDKIVLPSKNHTGYYIGVLPSYKISDKLKLTLEAQYSSKGFGVIDTLAVSSDFRLNYLDFIPQIEYNLSGGLWVAVGINYGLVLNESTKVGDGDWSEPNFQVVKDTDLGFKAMMRLFLTESLNIYAGFNTSIVDVEAFVFTDSNGDVVDASQFNKNVQIGLGYTFSKKKQEE
jgi:hypothetical protein